LEQKAIEDKAKEKAKQIYQKYVSKGDLLTNFQMTKAYFKDSGANISNLVERILLLKYNLPWQEKIVKRVVASIRGKKNAVVSIPQFKYEEKMNDILAKFVKDKFDKMVGDVIQNKMNIYPLFFREMVETCS
jgi:predicted YcjX-like family ATPase